jgi:hypothetical protein
MTFNALYIDGEKVLRVEFDDSTGYHMWQQSMTAIKEEAARINDTIGDPANLSIAEVAAIRNWLTFVDAMVDAGTTIVPSIRCARTSWAEAISDIAI